MSVQAEAADHDAAVVTVLKLTKGARQSYVCAELGGKPKFLMSVTAIQHERLHGDVLVRILRKYNPDVPLAGGHTFKIEPKIFAELRAELLEQKAAWLEHIASMEREKPKVKVLLFPSAD
jgi:hypothetical protein